MLTICQVPILINTNKAINIGTYTYKNAKMEF